MPRAKAITLRGKVQHFAESTALLREAGDCVFVIRGVPRSLVMRCPDGCGEVVTVNLDRRSGPAWRTFETRSSLTVYPSVWRETGCRAHFIIWNNRILWCDTDDAAPWDDDSLIVRVRAALPPIGSAHKHFEEIAQGLDAVPWEVLWACQRLERAGAATSSARGTKFGASHKSVRRTSIDYTV